MPAFQVPRHLTRRGTVPADHTRMHFDGGEGGSVDELSSKELRRAKAAREGCASSGSGPDAVGKLKGDWSWLSQGRTGSSEVQSKGEKSSKVHCLVDRISSRSPDGPSIRGADLLWPLAEGWHVFDHPGRQSMGGAAWAVREHISEEIRRPIVVVSGGVWSEVNPAVHSSYLSTILPGDRGAIRRVVAQ